MKKNLNRFLAFLLAVCMALPMGSFGSLNAYADDDQNKENTIVVQEEENEQETNEAETTAEAVTENQEQEVTEAPEEKNSEPETSEEESASESQSAEEESKNQLTSLTIQDDFHNQYGAVLLQEGLLSAENEEAVAFTYEKTNDSVIISGKRDALLGNKILIDKEYNFDDTVLGRFSIDMSAPKRTYITIGFYLDDATEPFFTTQLVKQKQEDSWELSKEITTDIYDSKITGTHKISFALMENAKTPKNVSFSFKSFEFVKSSVPVVYFDIDEEDGTIEAMNEDVDHNTECYGTMSIRVPDGYQSEYGTVKAGKETYDLDYIRGRGNSTWSTSKKPYKIKLADKENLLGMGKQKHWVLIANYYDNSLLRNKITYWLGEQINSKIADAYAFTPASVAVDVVMNGEYYGSYYLCEQVRVGTNRVDITDLEDSENADEVTGGYLLSLSPYYTDENDIVFYSQKVRQEFLIESPQFEDGDVNQAQVDYIENYVQDVEDAIYGENFTNSKGEYYGDLMDITSTAYYYLMQEFSMNGDGFISGSTYLYKTPDTTDENGNTVKGKLYWGPLWDFDFVAWGSQEYTDMSTSGWRENDRVWFEKLFENSEFNEAVINEAWPTLKAQLEELIKEGGQLDQYYEQLCDSADYNFEHLGFTPFETEYDEETDEYITITLTYKEEIERLRTWITKRIAWVDDNIDTLAPQSCEVTFKLGSKTVTQTETQGRTVSSFPAAPTKKGYTFTNWNISYTMNYEEYLAAIGLSEEDLKYWFDDEEEYTSFIESLKKDGYTEELSFSVNDALPDVSAVTITPVYQKTSELILPEKLYTAQPTYIVSEEEGGFYISAGASPVGAMVGTLTWSSSKTDVATIDQDGLVTPVSSGTTTITVSNGTLKTTCKVKVLSEADIAASDYDIYPTGAFFNYTSVTMNLGTCKHFYLDFLPEGCLNSSSYVISSTDENVVEVGDAGVAMAVGTGTCSLVAVYDGIPTFCKVKVVDPDSITTGQTFTSNGLKYKVTSVKSGTVALIGASKKTITKLTVPSTVKYKGGSFKVTSIANNAFSKYSKLKYVTLGANVQKIGTKAFYYCKKLYSVKTGKKLVYIGAQAFGTCTALRKIYIKSTSPKLYASSFSGLKSSAKVYVPKKWTGYYKMFIKKAHVLGKY